jgi:DNA-binding response OmpR family regulator
MKILIIEDDLILGESLKEYLELQNIKVNWIDDDRDALLEFSSGAYDFIILDLMLRYTKGEYILKEIRKIDKEIPIIIITAKDKLESKEECFSCGADDYIVKPFNPKELLLRIKTIYKRILTNDIIQIGDIEVHIDKQILVNNGKEEKITKKEWEMLLLLIKNRGKLVSFDCILNYVWGDTVVGTDSVRTYIHHLRSILPKNAIETYKGRGYLLKKEL